MAKKKRSRRDAPRVEDVPMSPMIDIVFQLLIYFVFTFDPVDLFANLEVIRPQSDAQAKPDTPPPEMYKVLIGPRMIPYDVPGSRAQFSINDKRPVSTEGLDLVLQSISAVDPEQTISFISSGQAIHNDLIDALNLCTKHGLMNVNVLPSHTGDKR